MDLLIVALIALVIVSIGAQHLYARASAKIVREGVQFLDSSLAEALQKIVEDLPIDLQGQVQEPMNPIQQLIAQKIAESFNPTVQVTEVNPSPRDPSGKFSKDGPPV